LVGAPGVGSELLLQQSDEEAALVNDRQIFKLSLG
jgi:hypothetical protein